MRQWIKQPYGKNQCGQVAVAVIAGITLEESIKLIGKKGCTKTKDLVKALRKLGFKCPDRCKKMPRPLLGIGHLNVGKKSGWHWVVVEGDKTFDGERGDEFGNVYRWELGWKITSYLPVDMPDVKPRYNEIVDAGKYSEGECHDIASVLCFIRDCPVKEKRDRAEKLLHSFITKKKLGDPVVFKKLKEEFGFE